MLREPLGWLVSRYYVELKRYDEVGSFDDSWGGLNNFWQSFSTYYKNGHFKAVEQNAGPTWEEVELIKTRIRDEYLVLLTERYSESLELLEYALGAPKSNAFQNFRVHNTMSPVVEESSRTTIQVKDLKAVSKSLPKMDYIYAYAEHLFDLQIEEIHN
eukprot:CAMPEP_0113952736 /NCGR_PEP_ID=MMETSP1339-20121228/90592_1 /TAXON_ID=94617 /ORGANISM="Fibrocapsa japonica" /LENGTH=157 /DNA_ID=CAMNT_0000961395 /DNA_START=373 /DNA_END=846 /DNA_ORIENTATION=+ /assembly_acc=CAM_ASM_000762